jgi:predicted N-acetyltransferase YhbS
MQQMLTLARAEGPILERILDANFPIWNEGLTRRAYGQWWAAQLRAPWARAHLSRTALMADSEVKASAKEYWFDAVLDRRPVTVVGIGAVFTQPAHRRAGAAAVLMSRLLDRAAAKGAQVALLFSEIGADYYARLGFTPLPAFDLELVVTEPARAGAPATLVRAADTRDLDAIVAMNDARARPFRFHLRRDRDLVEFAIARKRLLAGLSPIGARELRFVVAEEGATAAAYLVVSVDRRARDTGRETWTIEECGDRDAAGARVGAMLQVLLAREPAERRPRIRAWLPPGFRPPQVTIAARQPSADVMMVKPLAPAADAALTLSADDILYWRGDVF